MCRYIRGSPLRMNQASSISTSWKIRGLAVLVTLFFLTWSPSWSQEQTKDKVKHFGTEAFANLLHNAGLKPIKDLNLLPEYQPEETVIVVFGDPRPLLRIQKILGNLEPFLRRGGALLVATERYDMGALRELKVAITGEPIRETPENSYLGFTSCPLISKKYFNNHPILAGVGKPLVPNHPSRLLPSRTDCELEPLAWFPSADKALFYLPKEDRKRYRAYIMASSADRKERVLLIAGHGIFMNIMLAQPGTGNFSLAYNSVRWLTDNGKRKYAIFVEEGDVKTEFELPLSEKKPPFPQPTVKIINQMLQGLQEENAFNRIAMDFVAGPRLRDPQVNPALETFRLQRGKRRIVEVILAVLVILTLFFLFIRSTWARFQLEPQSVFSQSSVLSLFRRSGTRWRDDPFLPTVSRILEETSSPTPLIAQRHKQMVIEGKLLETARSLTQLWLNAIVPKNSSLGMPPLVRTSKGWWQRGKWQKQLEKCWQLAYGSWPGKMTDRLFRNWVDQLRRLDKEYQSGAFQLEWQGD